MMCACDEEIGRKFLPHQLREGVELETQERIQVTEGFVSDVCEGCRGLPLTAYPASSIIGRTTNARRYYWREIAFETMKRLDARSQEIGSDRTSKEYWEARKQIEKEVVAEIQQQHAISPKYTYKNETDASVITRYAVEVASLSANYVRDPTGQRAIIVGTNGPCTVESFVTRHYQALGFDILPLESRPFHVLFGVYAWLVIQDFADPLVRVEGFGDRIAYDNNREGDVVWFHKPQDFGTKGYGLRRAQAIDEHFSPDWLEEGQLQFLFDLWLEPSAKLRQYLWAHSEEDVAKAQTLISILPASAIVRILRYMVEHYWGRYLGWPDLLVYSKDEFFLAEVKASGDKLSDDQKRWIKDNNERLELPFKLVKVNRVG
ncbi:VRR-NUC domain-containing protein [Bradyrhizobium aeschynomenes]|uniref:VRR-NUC domain-containing protein n=1 Tax=Bradyrhizobium aeschynomenes TaxID=2734909 RepID=UPI001FF05A73|nr:VRR-NUC domain-containing protein [Bradyrhizobium aeschynomenes]